MKQSNVIKGTLAVVALVAALVVGVAVHMHSVGSPTAGHSTQNTAKTATETTAKTAESITADYPGYSSAEEGVKAAGLVVTGVPLDSRERILYPEIDFTSGTPETNPQYGLTEDDIDMDEYLTRWGPGLLRLGAIMSFGGYCVSRPGLLRLGAVVG